METQTDTQTLSDTLPVQDITNLIQSRVNDIQFMNSKFHLTSKQLKYVENWATFAPGVVLPWRVGLASYQQDQYNEYSKSQKNLKHAENSIDHEGLLTPVKIMKVLKD